jgi:hypothetical protein
MEERWSRNGLTSAQIVDSFTKGENVDAVLKRAPNPSSDHEWTDRRDEDEDRDRHERREGKQAPARREEPERRRVISYFDGQRKADLDFTNGVLQEKHVRRSRDFEQDRRIFAVIFQFFYLRLAIFFGCLGIFMNLFRGEMLDKTLHFWFLMPVRREVLLAGKYIAGLTAATVSKGRRLWRPWDGRMPSGMRQRRFWAASATAACSSRPACCSATRSSQRQ